MNYPYTWKEHITMNLIRELDVTIGNDGFIYDSMGCPITIDGRGIKCSIDPMNPICPSTDYYVLDPITGDVKMFTYLLGYFLKQEEENNGIRVETIATCPKDNNRWMNAVLVVLKQPGNEVSQRIMSRYYYNTRLAYADAILTIGQMGFPSDLTNFDEEPEYVARKRGK